MSEGSEPRVRLIVDGTGACAVCVVRGRDEPSFSAEIPRVGQVLAAAGLRLVGVSIATRPGGDEPSPPGEPLAEAVARVLSERSAVGAAS